MSLLVPRPMTRSTAWVLQTAVPFAPCRFATPTAREPTPPAVGSTGVGDEPDPLAVGTTGDGDGASTGGDGTTACGWNSQSVAYECGFGGVADPAGAYPIDCETPIPTGPDCDTRTFYGCCDGSGNLHWCDGTTPVHVDCSNYNNLFSKPPFGNPLYCFHTGTQFPRVLYKSFDLAVRHVAAIPRL